MFTVIHTRYMFVFFVSVVLENIEIFVSWFTSIGLMVCTSRYV